MAVVRDDDECAVVILQRFGERLAHLDVEVIGGLVQQQQVGLLPDEQREREPRFLAAGEAADRMADHVAAEIETSEKVAELLLACPGIDFREMPQRRLVGTKLLDLMLREVADRQCLRRVALAGLRRQRSGDRLEERRFPGPVGAEEPDAIAVENAPVEPIEYRWTARIAERHVLELHETLRRDRHRRESELERAVGVRGRDPLHALERLDPALRLLRLRGLGPEAIDERLQMGDLPLLLRVSRLLQRELLRTFALELRIVAAVGLQLPRVEMDDSADDAIEKIAVVRDEQQRSGVAREPVLQPQHGVEVEVIGGLVEEQEVRAAHQGLREIEPHSPAARESGDRTLVSRCGESEPREERRGARSGRVAADFVVAMMEVRERLALSRRIGAGSGLGGFERALDLAELAIPILDEIDRRRGRGERFLRDVRDRPGRREFDAPGILVRVSEKQREKARLAAAVRTDKADLVSGMNGEIRAVEQALGAAGENEVGDAKHGALTGNAPKRSSARTAVRSALCAAAS